MERILEFLAENGIDFERGVSGARFSSFRIGGEIAVLACPDTRERLALLLDFLARSEVGYFIVGRGSDILISDEGYDGVFVSLGALSDISTDGELIRASAGASMSAVAVSALGASLSGLEFMHGIPGSIGGGIYMNAGAYGGEIADVLVECECYDVAEGRFLTLSGRDCGFSYRSSIFRSRRELVVVSATLRAERGEREAILGRMNELKRQRAEKQPLEFPSAGSTFKRPQNAFAGKLIEDCGLKGYRIGGAQVSEKHAGFIVNRGEARGCEVAELIEHIKSEVYDRFGVMLECEVEFVGFEK